MGLGNQLLQYALLGCLSSWAVVNLIIAILKYRRELKKSKESMSEYNVSIITHDVSYNVRVFNLEDAVSVFNSKYFIFDNEYYFTVNEGNTQVFEPAQRLSVEDYTKLLKKIDVSIEKGYMVSLKHASKRFLITIKKIK